VSRIQSSPPSSFTATAASTGGVPGRLDDDQLARLAEEERVEAGLDDYDPDEVPPATDEPPEPDIARFGTCSRRQGPRFAASTTRTNSRSKVSGTRTRRPVTTSDVLAI